MQIEIYEINEEEIQGEIMWPSGERDRFSGICLDAACELAGHPDGQVEMGKYEIPDQDCLFWSIYGWNGTLAYEGPRYCPFCDERDPGGEPSRLEWRDDLDFQEIPGSLYPSCVCPKCGQTFDDEFSPVGIKEE